jgi:hypothetical protein
VEQHVAKAPQSFRIGESAGAEILSILAEINRFDPAKDWIAAIVWSTSIDASGVVLGSGPSVALYELKDVTADQICHIDNMDVVFPSPNQSEFENKTLSFDDMSKRFIFE